MIRVTIEIDDGYFHQTMTTEKKTVEDNFNTSLGQALAVSIGGVQGACCQLRTIMSLLCFDNDIGVPDKVDKEWHQLLELAWSIDRKLAGKDKA